MFENQQHLSHRSGVMLVVCAPSGAGKTTLIQRLLEEFPSLGFSISCTTRSPRIGEQDGKDYHFISTEEFLTRRQEGFFAEWAKVHGNFYGTPLKPLQEMLAQGEDILFDIDVQGAAQLRRSLSGGVYVFLFPPSLTELERRLRQRGTDDDETIARRIQDAKQEMEKSQWFDAWIVNNDLNHAYDELRAVFLTATLAPCNRSSLITSIMEG